MMRLQAPVFSCLPTLFSVVGAVLGLFIGAWLLAYSASRGYVLSPPPGRVTGDWILMSALWSFGAMGVVSFSAGFVGLLLQRSKLRPYLGRAIREHANPNQNT